MQLPLVLQGLCALLSLDPLCRSQMREPPVRQMASELRSLVHIHPSSPLFIENDTYIKIEKGCHEQVCGVLVEFKINEKLPTHLMILGFLLALPLAVGLPSPLLSCHQ